MKHNTRWIVLFVTAAFTAALIGCSSPVEHKPDKGTSYYDGPINKSGAKSGGQ
jgi:hypothetical protein